MNATCKAIILKQISYSETSLIVFCFTQDKGLKSFMYKGGKKKRSTAILPLKILEISYYQHREDSLASISSVQTATSLPSLYQHPVKISILFFLGEFLNQLLSKIQYTEEYLFEEIEQELIWLNESTEFANYPIFWLIQWIEKLGLKPSLSEGDYFDIESAQFTRHNPKSLFYQKGEEMRILSFLFTQERLPILSYSLTKNERTKIFNTLVDYYRFHVPEFKSFKSVEILQTILN
jgi:DNA repair protein RecO (recombination protein O)